MAIYVYITDTCRENAITHGLHQDLERFASRVEKAQSLELFANFPPPYLVKRKFGGDQGRLIAEFTRLPGAEEHTIVCFLAVLIRGSREYDHGFGVKPVEYGNQHFQGLYNQENLFDWLTGRLEQPVPERTTPTGAENQFLHAVYGAATGGDDWTVAESNAWVNKVVKPEIDAHLGSLWEAVCRIADRVHSCTEITGIEKAGNTWAIQWRRYPDWKIVVLEDVIGADAKNIGVAPSEPSVLSREEILMPCRRAYLDIVTADQKQWLAIQRDSEGNLALSPEEEEVIESTRPATGTAFPLFINGRAGSGKSTVLQYLFSDYLMTYLDMLETGQLSNESDENKPSDWPAQGAVYFTCSKDLLRRACTTVEVILRNGAQYWHKPERREMIERRRKDIEKAFCELRGYLLSLVPEGDKHLFDDRNYVSYPRYQRLWIDKFGRERAAIKEHGPAVSWHVIRTHIKGATADDLLDPDEYLLLDKKQRTVSQDVFKLIYEKVWDKWYRRKCEGEHLWDDQDLARYLLERELVKPVFHAIFCDEAQDFTSVELQAILRLSVFSDRKLIQSQVNRVPFVFAGDPFQTLNPTGFRWETTKASYFKNFVLSLNPWGDSETSLNYRELIHNYRSSRSIVGLCNLIQVRRADLFQMKSVRPQHLWSDEEAVLPVYWFAKEDNTFWSEFSKQKDLIVIAPCAEGGEAEYVTGEPELKARVTVKGDTPENVWSAIRSKGLEFDRVVIYGFGASEEATQMQKWAQSGEADDASKRLPAEYFFNQLYVAASRAKHALFVVDTRAAIDSFWSFACSKSLEELLSKAPGGMARWRPFVEQMVEGHVETLRTGKYEPVRMAESLEQQGMYGENAFILRQAAVHFRNSDNHAAAERCEAFASIFEGKYREAGRSFLAQKRWNEAVQAFWMDGADGRRELHRVGTEEAEINRKLEWRIADALESNVTDVVVWNTLLDEVCRQAKQDNAQWRAEQRKGWSDAVLSGISRVVSAKKTSDSEAFWLELFHRIEDISKLAICTIGPNDKAIIAARAGRHEDARKLFEAAGCNSENLDEQPTEFIESIAESVQFPRNLRALYKLKKYHGIVAGWEAKSSPALPETSMEIVVAALLHEERFADALPLAVRGQLDVNTARCALRLAELGDEHNARRAALCSLMLLARRGDWDAALELIGKKINLPDGRKLTWQSMLGAEFLWGVAHALAGAEPIKTAELSHRFSDFIKAGTNAVDPASEPDIRLLGAAIERTGQINDSIQFYEHFLAKCPEDSTSVDFRKWMRGRLLKGRWKRSLTRLRKTPEAAKTDQIGIRNELEKWKLGTIESLPDFPERLNLQLTVDEILSESWRVTEKQVDTSIRPATLVTAPSSTTVPESEQSSVEIDRLQLLGLDFQINRMKGRITITKPPGDDRVRVNWMEEKTCSSDLDCESSGKSTWKIPSWDIEVSLHDDGARQQAIVRWISSRIELRFDI